MKKIFLAFFATLATLTALSFTALADDFDPMDCLVAVYTLDDVAYTVYDMSLIPAWAIFDDDNQNSPFNLLNRSLIGSVPAMVSSQVGNLNMRISLLYDNKYSEKVLLPGKNFTVEVLAQNLAEGTESIQVLTAFYTAENRLVTLASESAEVGNELQTITSTITVPKNSEVSSAKVMIWNSFSGMTPYTAPVLLTLNSNDYFGDDYTISQPLSNKSEIMGNINSDEDIDVFSFTAQKDGLYIFESYGDTDTYAEIYHSADLEEPMSYDNDSGADGNFRLSAKLAEGQTYYLYVTGNETGDYLVRSMYAIGNIIGTVSPVKYYDEDEAFSREIEATAMLSRYDTNEFVAAMHLKEWSKSDIDYASFDLMGIFGGNYLVKIARPGYLSRYLKISLDDNVINLGTKTLLAGDVNGDNIINQKDANRITSLYNKQYGDALYDVNADLNGDKVINSDDLALLTPNLNKDSNIYNENVNVITVNAVADGKIMTISGTAKPDTEMICTVTLNNIIIYQEKIYSDNVGAFREFCNLSRTGTHKITLTSENRAFDSVLEYVYN